MNEFLISLFTSDKRSSSFIVSGIFNFWFYEISASICDGSSPSTRFQLNWGGYKTVQQVLRVETTQENKFRPGTNIERIPDVEIIDWDRVFVQAVAQNKDHQVAHVSWEQKSHSYILEVSVQNQE